jgi:hypothetical protein
MDLPELEIFEIKYGCEWFNEKNNDPFRNYLWFEMDFEWKITEASRVWNSIEFDGISSWDLRFWWNLGKGYPFAPRWQLNSWKWVRSSNQEFLDLVLQIYIEINLKFL